MTEFDCPEVTLSGRRNVKIQLLREERQQQQKAFQYSYWIQHPHANTAMGFNTRHANTAVGFNTLIPIQLLDLAPSCQYSYWI